MNNKITYFVCFIVLVGMSFAVDFTPQGNINGRNVYSIYGFVTINGTNIYQDGKAVLDTDDLNGSTFNYSRYSNSSFYWDNLNTPSDINAGDITNDGTYILSSSEGNLNVNSSDYWDSLGSPSDITGLSDSQISSLSWSKLNNYPASCPANTYLTQLGDSVTCTGISDVYLLNTGDTATGNYVFTSGTFDVDTVNTGQGDNELYAMNQDLESTDSPTFAGLNMTSEIIMNQKSIVGLEDVQIGDINGDAINPRLFLYSPNARATGDREINIYNNGGNELYFFDSYGGGSPEMIYNIRYGHLTSIGNLDFGGTGIFGNSVTTKSDGNGFVHQNSTGGTRVFSLLTSDNGRFILRDSSNTNTIDLRTDGDSYFNGGDVGIGTTSPSAKLDVVGNTELNSNLSVGNVDNTFNELTIFKNFAGSGKLSFKRGPTTTDGSIYVNSIEDMHISYNEDDTGDNLIFLSNDAEKVRLDNNGNVGIGTTSPDQLLQVENGAIKVGYSTDTFDQLIEFVRNDITIGAIDNSGSDVRIKALASNDISIIDEDNNGLTVKDGGDAEFTEDVSVSGNLIYTGDTQTISGGNITVTSSYMVLEPEGLAASDDLNCINGGTTGQVLYIRTANAARDITLKYNNCPDTSARLLINGDADFDINANTKVVHCFQLGSNGWNCIPMRE